MPGHEKHTHPGHSKSDWMVGRTIEPLALAGNTNVADMIEHVFAASGFNGRKLGEAAELYSRMLKDGATVGLTVSGETAGAQNVDLYTVLSVEEFSRSRCTLGVASAEVFFLEALEILIPENHIHIDRGAPMPILVECEGPDNCIGYCFGLKDAC